MDGNPDTSRSLGCFSVSPTSAGVSSWCVSSSQAPLCGSSSSSVLFLGPVHRLVPFPPVVFCTDAAVVQKTHPSELCLFSLPPSLSAALGLAASQRWHQPFYCSLSLSLSLSPYTSCPSLPLYLKAPPIPYFYTLCLLYLYLYSLYPLMLLMAESQKHKLEYEQCPPWNSSWFLLCMNSAGLKTEAFSTWASVTIWPWVSPVASLGLMSQASNKG